MKSSFVTEGLSPVPSDSPNAQPSTTSGVGEGAESGSEGQSPENSSEVPQRVPQELPPIGAVLAEALGAERVELKTKGKVIDLMAALVESLRAAPDGDVRSHPDRVDGRPQDEGQS